MPKVVVF